MLTPPRTWAEVPGYVRTVLTSPFRKAAEDGLPGLNTAADVMGWRAGPLNANYGGPRPLANLLVGGALGSLGGYGLGRLAESVLPERYFEPGAARRRGAVLGGLLGAAYPAYQAMDAVRETGDLGSVLAPYPPPPKQAGDDPWAKGAADLFAPTIPVDQFAQAIFRDTGTPLPVRAATAGLVEAADAVRGDGSRWVSPWDIARVAAGAGVGLAGGVVAGKALGLLAGLTPQAQQRLQDVGVWSGVVRQVVPQALGLGSR